MGSSIDGPPPVCEGGVTEYVRAREELRNRAQRLALELKTGDFLHEVLSKRLQGTMGILHHGEVVDVHPREEPKGVYTGRKWVGPCSVIYQDGKVVWVRMPGGEAKLIHRHQIRPREVDRRLTVELGESLEECAGGAHAEGSGPGNGEQAPEGTTRAADGQETGRGRGNQERARALEGHPGGRVEPGGIAARVKARHLAERNAQEGPVGDRGTVHSPEGGREPVERGRRRSDATIDYDAELGEPEARRARIGMASSTGARKGECATEGCGDFAAPDVGSASALVACPFSHTGLRDGPEFDCAKSEEWSRWENNGVFEWVPDAGQTAQRTRWILSKKEVKAEGAAMGGSIKRGCVPKARRGKTPK